MLSLLWCTWLAIGPGGDRISVAWEFPGPLLHFDVRSGTVAGQEIASRPPDIQGVCRLNRFEGSVTILDPATRKPLAKVPVGREPSAAALTPDGRYVYVTCHLPEQPALADHVAAKVAVLDIQSRAVSAVILLPNGSTGVRSLAISPDGRHAFVPHLLARYTLHTTQLEQGWMNTNALSIIDVAAQRLRATVLLDDVDHGAANPWAVAVSPDSTTLYVTHAGTHEISLIDLPALLDRIATSEVDPSTQLSFLLGVRRRIPLPGRGPRAIAVQEDRVWVAEYFTRTLTRLSPGRRPRLETFPIGPAMPLTPERRGEMLFHDASLCFQHWQSCSSCHPDGRVDGLNWDLVNDGLGNPKNTRTMVHAHKLPPVMWTGVRPSAEYAVRSGMRHILFREPDEEEARAIDAYLKSLRPVPGPERDKAAVARGRRLFFSPEVGCGACHPAPLYTDNRLHEVGTQGEFDFTLSAAGRRIPQTRFKTPSLVEVWRTAPYRHDGRYATLREVITQGNHGDLRGKTSHLTEAQVDDLIAFLRSL